MPKTKESPHFLLAKGRRRELAELLKRHEYLEDEEVDGEGYWSEFSDTPVRISIVLPSKTGSWGDFVGCTAGGGALALILYVPTHFPIMALCCSQALELGLVGGLDGASVTVVFNFLSLV